MTRRVSLFALYICGLGPKRFLNLQRKFTTAKNMATSLQPGCNNSEEKSENWKPLSVKLGTFNLLAPCYNVVKSREHKTFWGGRKESSFPDLYLPRYDEIFKVFDGLPTFDCMCLQEYWFNNDIAELFEKRIGDRYYIYKHKRPTRQDGVALLISKKHSVIHVEYIKFHDMGMRVALLAHVVILDTGQEVVFVTTHLTYLANYLDQFKRMGQAKKLGHVIDSYMSSLGRKDIPLFLSGDFNGSPDGPIYNYFTDLGFVSAYKSFHGTDPLVTHVDHNGSLMPADYIFYRMPALLECTVVDAFLVPKDRTDKDWPGEFLASDHRPVFTELSISQEGN